VRLILDNGRNMMPAFKQMPESEKAPLITFLLDLEDKEAMPANPGRAGVSQSPPRDIVPAFSMTGYHRFMDADGYPGIKPPWGTLNAVNLSRSEEHTSEL